MVSRNSDRFFFVGGEAATCFVVGFVFWFSFGVNFFSVFLGGLGLGLCFGG